MLTLVPQEMEEPAPYPLLTSIVAPRPIAWVSTISTTSVPNLAPYSFFNAVAGFPPPLRTGIGEYGADAAEYLLGRSVEYTKIGDRFEMRTSKV
ncbi:MAG: hypothetical protein KME45_31660 [Stenomitos rutilans HA7619-LM2]|jgi:flavin reductase (DIM6/NTAB) family NADH-FMN oxidoreductase RutF|nr:hypothetical protein [Stenomitos rutilans HA7619-LM2]